MTNYPGFFVQRNPIPLPEGQPVPRDWDSRHKYERRQAELFSDHSHDILLTQPLPHFISKLASEHRQMPLGSGTPITFRRYSNLGTAPIPLSNGNCPPPERLAYTDIDCTLSAGPPAKWAINPRLLEDDWTYNLQTGQLTHRDRPLDGRPSHDAPIMRDKNYYGIQPHPDFNRIHRGAKYTYPGIH